MGLRVLVVDSDTAAATARAAELAASGHVVVRAIDVASASEILMRETIDSIVCSDALRAEIERAYAAVLPVLPASGQSTAVLARTLALLARRSLSPTVQLSITAQLDAALAGATLALEPVVRLSDGALCAHRATLMAPSVTTEDMSALAANTGRVLELRRAVRRLACEAIQRGGVARLLLDCSIEDLLDGQLYDATSTWGQLGGSLLLVVAERDVLVLAEADARDRLRSLRGQGFEIVARVGTDIAGLTSVGVAEPSYALVDLAAFGEPGPVLTRVVASVVAACREVAVDVIADVPTPEHAACARETGCAMAFGRGVVPGAWA